MGAVLPLSAQAGEHRRNLDALIALVAGDMDKVNEAILDRARSPVGLIEEISNYLTDAGGKRLRPMLTLAAARLCGYEGRWHVNLATAVEFMHTATLLHDDVVDESDLRRGKTTARLVWNNQASVLVGDYLLGQAFRLMVETGSLAALRILSDAAAVIAEGEVHQLTVSRDLSTTEDAYLRVIDAKTAALFAAAAQVGGIIAGASKEEEAALSSFGRNLGIAFQLVDDALDYSGRQKLLGKTVGDDFREGKITLPVVLAYRRGSVAERDFWVRAFEDDGRRKGDFHQAIALMEKYDALEDTMKRARHYGAIADDALAIFPAGACRQALSGAVAFNLARGH